MMDKIVLWLLAVLTAVFLAGVVWAGYRQTRADAYCLERGFTSAKLTVRHEYCVRRVNGTDETYRIYWEK